MPRSVYVDSSALAKLVVEETESEPLRAFLQPDARLASSIVAAVEVPRAARRRGVAEASADVLATVTLLDVTDEVVAGAVALDPTSLRSLDAIHLASALLVDDLDAFVVYDERLAAAAVDAGLSVQAPA